MNSIGKGCWSIINSYKNQLEKVEKYEKDIKIISKKIKEERRRIKIIGGLLEIENRKMLSYCRKKIDKI